MEEIKFSDRDLELIELMTNSIILDGGFYSPRYRAKGVSASELDRLLEKVRKM